MENIKSDIKKRPLMWVWGFCFFFGFLFINVPQTGLAFLSPVLISLGQGAFIFRYGLKDPLISFVNLSGVTLYTIGIFNT